MYSGKSMDSTTTDASAVGRLNRLNGVNFTFRVLLACIKVSE